MSVNAFKPHVFVLPEDDATRQIATGFSLHSDVEDRNIQVLRPSGGWRKAVDSVRDDHLAALSRYPERRLVLLIDFDSDGTRRSSVEDMIPADLRQRVFVVGVWSEPEDLRNNTGLRFEQLGERLADACVHDTSGLWDHELLTHNKDETARLRKSVGYFLFR